jgi:hypothetical protein
MQVVVNGWRSAGASELLLRGRHKQQVQALKRASQESLGPAFQRHFFRNAAGAPKPLA